MASTGTVDGEEERGLGVGAEERGRGQRVEF
jgi:hypothetical protein